MKSKVEIGQIGERKARGILSRLGFKIDFRLGDEVLSSRSACDLLATRYGQKYAINVKYSSKAFVITWKNLRRMLRFRSHGYIPALFFLHNDSYMLFVLDPNFPHSYQGKLDSFTLEEYEAQ